jgi:hypothetical protein
MVQGNRIAAAAELSDECGGRLNAADGSLGAVAVNVSYGFKNIDDTRAMVGAFVDGRSKPLGELDRGLDVKAAVGGILRVLVPLEQGEAREIIRLPFE